jgi:ABC-2 type transport system permease protein
VKLVPLVVLVLALGLVAWRRRAGGARARGDRAEAGRAGVTGPAGADARAAGRGGAGRQAAGARMAGRAAAAPGMAGAGTEHAGTAGTGTEHAGTAGTGTESAGMASAGTESAGMASAASAASSAGRSRPWTRARVGEVGLVAAREVRVRVRSRVFRAVSVVLMLGVAAAVVVPVEVAGGRTTERIGVVGGSVALAAELRLLGRASDVAVVLRSEPNLPAARAALVAHRVDLVVDGTTRLVVDDALPAAASSASARLVEAVATVLGVQRAEARAGLTAGQAAVVAGARPLPVDALHRAVGRRTTAESTALISVIVVFMILTQYLGWTLMGVMEEKASRVVEVLLAAVRPLELLTGKVLGIGAVALAQAAAVVAVALLAATAVGSSLVHGSAWVVVVAAFVWLVLGYAFYSWLYAAAGSLAERQDQVQSLALPLSLPLLVGYIASLSAAGSAGPSLLVRVLAFVPPTAPFAMPTLVGLGAVTWWQFAVSVVLSVAATVGVAVVAGRVYRTAVLRTGARVRVREALRT